MYRNESRHTYELFLFHITTATEHIAHQPRLRAFRAKTDTLNSQPATQSTMLNDYIELSSENSYQIHPPRDPQPRASRERTEILNSQPATQLTL